VGDKLLNEIVLNSHEHYRKMPLTPKESYKNFCGEGKGHNMMSVCQVT